MPQLSNFEAPMDFLAFDLIGPLPVTDRDHKYALVGTDLFSKKIYATPLISKHAETIRLEKERVICSNLLIPSVVLTDHGTEFNDVTTLCDSLGIEHRKSPPYHPQANGAVERANRTLKQRLFDVDDSESWDLKLSAICNAINC